MSEQFRIGDRVRIRQIAKPALAPFCRGKVDDVMEVDQIRGGRCPIVVRITAGGGAIGVDASEIELAE